MARRDVIDLSRIDKWLPFFEEEAESRSTESWWGEIESKVLKWGMEIKGLVSDRAKALVKLGAADYLGVCSMPDLFHFCQDISKSMGGRIGRVHRDFNDKLLKANKEDKKTAKKEFKKADEIYKCYRQEMERINKTVHAFNGANTWVKEEDIEESLLFCVSLIKTCSRELNIEVEDKKIEKIQRQIQPIYQGIENWIVATKLELDELEIKGKIDKSEKEWMTLYALPYTYWEIQLTRTQPKKRNQNLRLYYKQRITDSKDKCREEYLVRKMPLERVNELLSIAHQKALTFQRSSSQVEGRNGYLSFVNHGHKGIPKDRLKVLTVVHNFDMKRKNGSTPAQRLFGKEFPDLFEFLCQNVTGFKEPRKRKPKSMNINFVQP